MYNEFEKQLMNMTPVEPELDPAAAAYEAGYRNGRQNKRLWQASCSIMTILVVLLAGLNYSASRPAANTQPARSNVQLACIDDHDQVNKIKLELTNIKKAKKELNENSYLLLRRRVLDEGLDALPESSGNSGKVYTFKDSLNI